MIRKLIAIYSKRRSLTIGLIAVAVILVVSTAYATWVFRRAQGLSAELLEQSNLTAGALLPGSGSTNAEFVLELEAMLEEAQGLERSMWPLRAVSAVAGPVPFVGDLVRVGPNLTRRIVYDLEIASGLLGSSEELGRIFEGMTRDELSFDEAIAELPGSLVLGPISSRLVSTGLKLEMVEEIASQVDHARLPGFIDRRSEQLLAQEARLRSMLDWSVLLVNAAGALREVGQAIGPVAYLLDEPSDVSFIVEDSVAAMQRLSTSSNRAAELLARANSQTPAEFKGSTPVSDLEDVEVLIVALRDSTTAFELLVKSVSPALTGTANAGGGLLGEGSGLIDGLELIDENRQLLAEAANLLGGVTDSLSSTQFSRRPLDAAAGKLAVNVESASSIIDLMLDASSFIPAMLGRDRPKNYLVLGITADELRGAGGFVSALWVLTIDAGQITASQYQDVVAAEGRLDLGRYPSPPEPLRVHMDASKWLMRDAGWSPNFDSVARRARELWDLGSGRVPIDGVIALNQWGIVDLVSALGSLDLGDSTVTGESTMAALESGTDEYGRAYTDVVFKAIQNKLMSQMSQLDTLRLANTLSRMASRKELQVFVFDDELQRAVARAGLTGSLRTDSGNSLAVVDSNVGWNKVDRNIVREVEYTVDLSGSEEIKTVTTVTYRNQSAVGSRDCSDQTRSEETRYVKLLQGCYWNFLRIYLPAGSRLVSSDPLPLPANSVYNLLGLGSPGDSTVAVSADEVGLYVSGLMAVSPGDSRTASFITSRPLPAPAGEESERTYELDVFAQAGVTSRSVIVNLVLPNGYDFKNASIRPDEIAGQRLRFSFDLQQDIKLSVTFTKA